MVVTADTAALAAAEKAAAQAAEYAATGNPAGTLLAAIQADQGGEHGDDVVDAISTNYGYTQTNATAIATNTAGVAANVATLETHEGLVTTNIANIATNTAGIAANVARLDVHEGLVTQNIADIAANKSQIASNQSQIALWALTSTHCDQVSLQL